MSSKTKAERGLCTFFGCQKLATIQFKNVTPEGEYTGYQLYCLDHWQYVTSPPLQTPAPERIIIIEPGKPVLI